MLTTPAAVEMPRRRFDAFQDLMPYRVQDILLVSSRYDAFALQEDGTLGSMTLEHILDSEITHGPGVIHVGTGREAVHRATRERRFNLIITSLDPGDMNATELVEAVAAAGLDVPVVLLAYDDEELREFLRTHDAGKLAGVFLWQGDARILPAIVHCVEDARNVAADTASLDIRVILLVEDNVRYYSSFLPVIYSVLLSHSHRLVGDSVNYAHRLLRLRARPKILLCRSFDEAWDRFTQYRSRVLGVISDVEFPRGGTLDLEAGFALAEMTRAFSPDLPVLLHSSRAAHGARAAAEGLAFLRKGSDTLLSELSLFMIDYFALGDFVFRLPDGRGLDHAADLKSLEEKLRTVPIESVVYHAARNHFSNWFIARTEFALAHKLGPRRVEDYATSEALREDLIGSIADYRREQVETRLVQFDRASFDPDVAYFARIGTGSLGGKARGLAFARFLLDAEDARGRFPDIIMRVPPSVVLATDVFDAFLELNGLREWALRETDDHAVMERFLAARLPDSVRDDLTVLVERVRRPLAVRSSSLLEDSQYQPFTGVYDTCMLANRDDDPATRLAELEEAIKRVYASTFTTQSKAYVRATPYRLEEEKMAVILQQVEGVEHGTRYYPDISGVARSYNFYPSPPATAEDGIVAVALGLGRAVVAGERCVNFCPRYPQHSLESSSVDDILDHSQREFWAIEFGPEDQRTGKPDPDVEGAMREMRFPLRVAEKDGVLHAVASTYVAENHAITDGTWRAGMRVVTFAPVLKHGVFPLAEAVAFLLEIGAAGMRRAVEIEFAVSLPGGGRPATLAFLQMRPLVLRGEQQVEKLDDIANDMLITRSLRVLGNGRIDGVHDVLVVDRATFERAHSRDVAREIAQFNAQLLAEERPYILLAVGRLGSTDPWLGIPVRWDEIAGARAIVETGLRDLIVTPSQGSHFFQNLTAFRVGYFTVNADLGEGFVDWEWLAAQPAVEETRWLRLLRFDEAVVVAMDGRRTHGVIYKPGCGPA